MRETGRRDGGRERKRKMKIGNEEKGPERNDTIYKDYKFIKTKPKGNEIYSKESLMLSLTSYIDF